MGARSDQIKVWPRIDRELVMAAGMLTVGAGMLVTDRMVEEQERGGRTYYRTGRLQGHMLLLLFDVKQVMALC